MSEFGFEFLPFVDERRPEDKKPLRDIQPITDTASATPQSIEVFPGKEDVNGKVAQDVSVPKHTPPILR